MGHTPNVIMNQPEPISQAPRQPSAGWPATIVMFGLGLYSTLAFHRFALGAVQFGVSAACAADQTLSRKQR